MHETMNMGSMSEMRPLERIPVRDGETLRFAPGGRHLMLFDIARDVAAGGRIDLVLHFERGDARDHLGHAGADRRRHLAAGADPLAPAHLVPAPRVRGAKMGGRKRRREPRRSQRSASSATAGLGRD